MEDVEGAGAEVVGAEVVGAEVDGAEVDGAEAVGAEVEVAGADDTVGTAGADARRRFEPLARTPKVVFHRGLPHHARACVVWAAAHPPACATGVTSWLGAPELVDVRPIPASTTETMRIDRTAAPLPPNSDRIGERRGFRWRMWISGRQGMPRATPGLFGYRLREGGS